LRTSGGGGDGALLAPGGRKGEPPLAVEHVAAVLAPPGGSGRVLGLEQIDGVTRVHGVAGLHAVPAGHETDDLLPPFTRRGQHTRDHGELTTGAPRVERQLEPDPGEAPGERRLAGRARDDADSSAEPPLGTVDPR